MSYFTSSGSLLGISRKEHPVAPSLTKLHSSRYLTFYHILICLLITCLPDYAATCTKAETFSSLTAPTQLTEVLAHSREFLAHSRYLIKYVRN